MSNSVAAASLSAVLEDALVSLDFHSRIIHVKKKMKYICKQDFIIFFVSEENGVVLWRKKNAVRLPFVEI